MILAFVLACQCQSTPKPIVPPVDRESVTQSTCYRADDGSLLELQLSAQRTVTGTLTRSGATPQSLSGTRSGRELHFDGLTVQLLGRTITVEDGADKMLMELGGCSESASPPAPHQK